LFSHDPGVVGPGAVYLRIVAPSYAALGFGFVIAFAAQGAGHVLWPFVGASSRLLLAAGGGWLAVSHFGGGITTIAAMVCISLLSYALICLIAMGSKSVWRIKKA
jgi:Na+-driven multidrug efflux pump